MNEARTKSTTWLVLVAFFAQLLPLPLFAKSIQWSDFKVYIEDSKQKKSGSGGSTGGNGGSGANSGSSSGSNSGSGSGTQTNTSNENKPRNTDSASQGSGAQPGKGTKSADGSIAHPLYYPMCLFVDTKTGLTPAQMDVQIKKMIQMSDACGVNLVVFPRWVNINAPAVSDPNGGGSARSSYINGLTSPACNITEAIEGAKSASVSTCDSSAEVAAEMCGSKNDKKVGTQTVKEWNQGVGGCAQVHAANGNGTSQQDIDELNRLAGGGGEKNPSFSGGSGEAVPSIEKAGACSANTIAHEAQGHSQFGKPNGSNHGNGIGDPVKNPNYNITDSSRPYDPNRFLPPQEGGTADWDPGPGCTTMRAQSFANDGRWKYNPKRNQYMPRDMKRILNVEAGEKVFKKKIAKGEKNQDVGFEEIGGERPGAGEPPNMRGNKIGRLGKIKIPGSSGMSGGHPELKQISQDKNASGKKDPSDVPAGERELGERPSFSSITGNESKNEDSKLGNAEDDKFFKELGNGKSNSELADIRSTETSSGSSSGAGPSSSPDGNVGQIVYSAREAETINEKITYTDPNDPNYLVRNPQNAKKQDARGSSLRNRLLTDVQSNPTGIASTSSNENAPKGEEVSERRESSNGRSSLAATGDRRSSSENTDGLASAESIFSASSDPTLDKKRKNERASRVPRESTRRPVDGRESNRRPTVEQTPAYTDSTADFGD